MRATPTLEGSNGIVALVRGAVARDCATPSGSRRFVVTVPGVAPGYYLVPFQGAPGRPESPAALGLDTDV